MRHSILSSDTAAGQNFTRSGTATDGATRGYEKWSTRKLTQFLGKPKITISLWDGYCVRPDQGESLGTVHIRNRHALNQLLLKGDVGFGDQFSVGGIDVEGKLADVLLELYVARNRSESSLKSIGEFLHKRGPQRNTLEGSRDHIHHHYDIGNDFYRLWLDQEMQYTCAYFPERGMTLEAAQQAKLDHVCRKLQLKAGDRVAEAGCGWGSLARHMAINYGAQVTAWNISHEQIEFAKERARVEGFDKQVRYVEDDYRTISGEYDVFVSVGMLEHVGRQNYLELGRVVDRCLAPAGRALIHTIGRNQPKLMNAWIEKRIFPGAYPPTLSEMMDILEPYCFSVLDVENLRLHYARTLEHWQARYDEARDEVIEMFDQDFSRAWRLYLAGSVAAFLAGSLQLFQVLFVREQNNLIPWSRLHQYRS
ncbi:MAG: cyclopropane-fatty-acyl-phospholipid synthase family protein [Arenicellales bacterium]|nr:cyclopropane-fatty-acyl-phospholipid synthase family protein [Arenicellales bacterium]